MVLMLLHGMGSFWVYCRLYLIASVHSGLVLGLLYHNTSSSRRVNAFYCQEFGATFFFTGCHAFLHGIKIADEGIIKHFFLFYPNQLGISLQCSQEPLSQERNQHPDSENY
jgi:hypothetical protein